VAQLNDRREGAVRAYRLRAASRRRGVVVRRLLIAADLLGLGLAFALLQILVGSGSGEDMVAVDGEVLLFIASMPVFLVLAQSRGLYARDEERPDHTTVDDLVGVVFLVTFLVWTVIVAASVTGFASPDLEKWVIFWAMAVAAVVLARSAARAVARRLPAYTQRTIVVGAGKTGQLIARRLGRHAEYGIDVLGFVDARPDRRVPDIAHLPVLGSTHDLVGIVERKEVDRVVIAFSRESPRELEELVRYLQAMGVQVDIVPRLFSVLGPNVDITTIEGMQLLSLPPTRMSKASLAAKRAFDVAVASLTLVVLAPVFALVALLIKRDSDGGVFFRQTRLGLDQRPFTFLKFRTMSAGTSPAAHRDYIRQVASAEAAPQSDGLFKLEQPSAVTRIGRFLRKTSLDELPQLLNVLRGEMSLVGPRPCIPYELEHFAPHHFERFTVPAGITGLWQVKARAHSTFAEALDLDVAYARSWSFGLDLKLLFQTPVHMLQRKGTK
jgi:exopolysaccharide biosynthesis polyprenyl glycosylphosphotransferase